MSAIRTVLAVTGFALALEACTHNDYMPNVIQLTPSGTASSPVPEPITSPFTLIAVEDGYTGQFTAATVSGTCWVVQAPVTSSGAWNVVPQGSTCATKLDVERIEVKDTNGHSAQTYIKSTP